MKLQNVSTLLCLLVLLSIAVLTSTRPAPLHEQEDPQRQNAINAGSTRRARRANGEPRKVSKRMADSEQNTESANNKGPKFMQDLFQNLSNSSSPQMTQANTIRSLPYQLQGTQNCGKYNFSISAINTTEFILNAELHLFLEVNAALTSNPLVAVITAKGEDGQSLLSSNGEEIRATIPFTMGTENRYVIFSVESMLKELLNLGKTHAVFQVDVYKDLLQFGNTPKNPIHCTEVKFIYQSFTDDNVPLFIVYSYDYKINEINYKEIEDYIANELQATSTEPQVSERRKRSKNDPPACKVNQLDVDSSLILPSMLRNSNNQELEVMMPDSYNAGICGGLCNSQTPFNTHHSTLISLLIDEPSSISHGYTNIKKSCSPVSYRGLEVFVRNVDEPGTSFFIFIIPNMIIDKCECIDIVDYS